MKFQILHSKLIRPEVSASSIARIDLENKLRDNRRSDVILVSSFAGSGKTTVISEWISRCDYEHIGIHWTIGTMIYNCFLLT
jgi:ATP/maltotriose-dependent transcriptional regulator MalT